MKICLRVLVVATATFAVLSANAQNKTVYARAKMPATGTPAAMDNPPCTADAHAKTLGQAIVEKGIDAIGKASAAFGLPGDPFNTRRLNQSVCMDLCVAIPQGASFTAKGSVSDPHGWQGDLSAGLPQLVNPGNWWAIVGPSVESTERGDLVCYTAKNWSHNLERHVGIEVKY